MSTDKQDAAEVAAEDLAANAWIGSSDNEKSWTARIIREAYAEQTDELEALREAIAPFSAAAKHMKAYSDNPAENGIWISPDESMRLTVANFQKAAEAKGES